jgi:hypothetical protein
MRMIPALAGKPFISCVSKRKQLARLGMGSVDSRADILDGFEKQVGSWIKNREAKKPMTLCKTSAHVMILPEIPPFRGPMDRLKKTSFLKIVILAPPS